jgi:hypothetical protein
LASFLVAFCVCGGAASFLGRLPGGREVIALSVNKREIHIGTGKYTNNVMTTFVSKDGTKHNVPSIISNIFLMVFLDLIYIAYIN